MPDFVQQGKIAAIHNFGCQPQSELEDLLRTHSSENRVGLIIPLTASEMREEPFANIVEHLREADYIEHIAITLGQARSSEEYRESVQRVAALGERASVLWTDGARVDSLYRALDEEGFDLGLPSKGRSAWSGIGYLLSRPNIQVIATHDCDIVTYDRGILARLCLPLVHSALDFEFCKAYYARYTTKLHGRVVRLLVLPLLESLMKIFANEPFLEYLYSYRYPLSGEFAGTRELLKSNRVPSDWSLEIGTLAEVFRNTSLKRVCQVDICPQYEHKHQTLSLEDATRGLMKMSVDILTSIFRSLASMGIVFESGHFLTLRAAYQRAARDSIRKYHADSIMNGLNYDRHGEEQAVEGFSRRIVEAGELFQSDPLGAAPIPSWNRILSVSPDFPQQLMQAAEDDRAEFA